MGQLPRKRVKNIGGNSKHYRIELGAGELVKEAHMYACMRNVRNACDDMYVI